MNSIDIFIDFVQNVYIKLNPELYFARVLHIGYVNTSSIIGAYRNESCIYYEKIILIFYIFQQHTY